MVLIADKRQRTDGTAKSFLDKVNSPIPIVLVSSCEGFVFNDELNNIGDYVLCDYIELGWDWDRAFGHTWGVNTDKFKMFDTDEWRKFDAFVKNNPPKISFVRELLKEDVSATTLPIEYPCLHDEYQQHNKNQYNERPINVFNFWGRSHEYRLHLHGNIWLHASRTGGTVCDNLYYLNEFMQKEKNPNKWVTLNIPDYCRTEMTTILAINNGSKLSVSLFGAGTKCFRMGESPVNSVMVMQESNIAYTYEWAHGVNCIKFPTDYPDVNVLQAALKRIDLYDIYLEGRKTIDKYRIANYTKNYIEPILNSL